MTKKYKRTKVQATHVLETFVEHGKVKAFNPVFGRKGLAVGKYPCAKTANPYDKKGEDEVLMLVNESPVLFVRLDFLEDSVDEKFWKLTRLSGKN